MCSTRSHPVILAVFDARRGVADVWEERGASQTMDMRSIVIEMITIGNSAIDRPGWIPSL